jgi:hypothetical protein
MSQNQMKSNAGKHLPRSLQSMFEWQCFPINSAQMCSLRYHATPTRLQMSPKQAIAT